MTDQPQEPYTRVPNAILDTMHQLGNAELRVLLAVARKTTGYQKECDRLSVSQIAKQTGLTPRNAQTAITALLERGWIGREPANKQSFCYRLTISLGDTVENHIPSDTISPRDMEPYPLGTRLDQKPYPLGITQKKDLKKKENDSRRSRKRDDAPPTPAPIREALADVCAVDMKHGPKESIIQVNAIAGRLWKAAQEKGASEHQVVEGVLTTAAYCRRMVYPYKDGQPLTPAAIHKHWRAAIQDRDKAKARANGAHVNGAAPARPVNTPEQTAALARELREKSARGEL